MGANDAKEMLEVAKAECLRLERENTQLTAALAAAQLDAKRMGEGWDDSSAAWGKVNAYLHEHGLDKAEESLVDQTLAALAAVPAPTEEVNSRFNAIKDRLITATGTPGLTSFHHGKVHMTLGEWERLVDLAEKTVPAPTDPREVAHIECDCVPDLGPTHCHLCSERAGHPLSWAEAHPVPTIEADPGAVADWLDGFDWGGSNHGEEWEASDVARLIRDHFPRTVVPAPTEADRASVLAVIGKHHLFASEDGGAADNCECGHDLTDGGLLPVDALITDAHDAHLADVLAGLVPAPKTQDGEAREAEWEYGIRADGDDEPWSDISDDLDWLVSETTSGPGFEHSEVVRRRKAGPWLPVSPEPATPVFEAMGLPPLPPFPSIHPEGGE